MEKARRTGHSRLVYDKAKRTIVKAEDVDAELKVLRDVTNALASVEPDVRLRMLQFLKSKFSKEWPSDNYN